MSNISSTCRFPKYSKGAHYVWSLAQWRVTNLCCLYHHLASTGKTVITTPARATGTDRWNFLRHENNLFVQCIPFSVASVISDFAKMSIFVAMAKVHLYNSTCLKSVFITINLLRLHDVFVVHLPI